MGRSLRVDARSLQVHLARFGLLVGIYVSLITVIQMASLMGAPGLNFLRGIAYVNLGFMSLLGISFFSTAISEEKEEDTLGLMQMAGISPIGILIGKTGGRLMQALSLIAIQYPFTLLAVTLGGVSALQINALYLGLAAYLFLLAGFGLFCSTIGSNNRVAATYMIVGLGTYTLIPRVISSLMQGTGVVSVILDRVVAFSVFEQMGTIMTTGFGDPTISWQVISNICVGVGCFGLAWALFGYGTRDLSSDAITRGIVPVKGNRFRRFSPGRAWKNPFVWKDFYFVSGGFGMIPVRCLFCLGLFCLMCAVDRSNTAISGFQVFLSLAIAIDAGRVMSGSIYDERRGQTLASLVMLPRSTWGVLYSKLAGAMLGWLPGAAINLLVSVGTSEGSSNLHWLLNKSDGFMITSFFVLIPHLSTVLSTYLRWGAVPLGTGIVIGTFLGLTAVISMPPSSFTSYALGGFNACLCICCHLVLVLRFRSLAAS